jgi:hypothetical protein
MNLMKTYFGNDGAGVFAMLWFLGVVIFLIILFAVW